MSTSSSSATSITARAPWSDACWPTPDRCPTASSTRSSASCERTGKPFEYAFLLDALKDEQARASPSTRRAASSRRATRDYIIIDAPGHIEFLKNMVTGAARAEAAVLVIDAKEGVRENSRRHGYILSMLGIRQVVVVVNKMDLVEFDQDQLRAIETEYRAFLEGIGAAARATSSPSRA